MSVSSRVPFPDAAKLQQTIDCTMLENRRSLKFSEGGMRLGRKDETAKEGIMARVRRVFQEESGTLGLRG